MKRARIVAESERFSKLLSEHRLRAFLITVVGVIMLAQSAKVFPDDTHVDAITWICLGLMMLSVLQSFTLLSVVDPRIRLVTAWGVSMSPFLFGYAGFSGGSPMSLMWLGAAVSLCLVARTAIFVSTDRDAQAQRKTQGAKSDH